MNSHDQKIPKPSDTKTNKHSEGKASEFATQAEVKALHNSPALPHQDRAEKILAIIMNTRRNILKEKLAHFSGHHSASSLEIYIDAVIRFEK